MMPHLNRSTATTHRNRSSSNTNTSMPIATNTTQNTIAQGRKTNVAPSTVMGNQKIEEHRSGHANNANNATDTSNSATDATVSGGVLTPRSVSPSSSISRGDTLVNLSDTGSTMTTEATDPNVAQRRLKFREEFGGLHSSGNLMFTKAEGEAPFAIEAYPSPPPTNKTQKSVKDVKAKGHKKSCRSRGPKLNFSDRNVYTGAITAGKKGSTKLDGGGGCKAMLGGPSVASGIVGCVVM